MFSRKIVPSCAYCRHATALGYNEYFCVRRGIMNSEGSCGKYIYEPTKRVPNSKNIEHDAQPQTEAEATP